ncbi:hypothetical protein H0H87_000707 [Tephrocybe sp. NHM501043]|nr:hypothetical protein H0H87_000707 [Tephrocybe sp. NHM501043]
MSAFVLNPRTYSDDAHGPHDPSFVHAHNGRNFALSSDTNAPFSSVLAHLSHNEFPHDQAYMANPYPPASLFPSITHKVWILDCKSCQTFLTNRGMKCMQCTSPTTSSNRATNGHRFVFHSNEVVATARRWIADEPGINPYNQVSLVNQSPQSLYPGRHDYQSRSPSPGQTSEYLSTPSLELADPFRLPLASNPFLLLHEPTTDPRVAPSQHLTVAQRNFAYTSVYDRRAGYQTLNSSSEATGVNPQSVARTITSQSSVEQKDQHPPHRLDPGDVLFWHHLYKSGEIPCIEDDERARGRPKGATIVDSPKLVFDR